MRRNDASSLGGGVVAMPSSPLCWCQGGFDVAERMCRGGACTLGRRGVAATHMASYFK